MPWNGPARQAESENVAFRSAKGALVRGAKGDKIAQKFAPRANLKYDDGNWYLEGSRGPLG